MLTRRDRSPAAVTGLLLACALAVAACGSGGTRARVVARAGALTVRADDLRLALRALPDGEQALAARPRVEALLADLFVDELLADEARASIPGAAARGRAAARERAIGLLLAGPPLAPRQLEAHYHDHLADYRIPDEVRLAELALPTCADAARVRQEIARGTISFAAAAGRAAAGHAPAPASAPSDWRRVDQLAPAVRRAVAELTAAGAVSAPVPAGPRPSAAGGPAPAGAASRPAAAPRPAAGGPPDAPCVLLQLVERRRGRQRTFAEVRDEVEPRAAAAARQAARAALLTQLRFAGGQLADGGVGAALKDEAGGDERRAVIVVGDERLTVGDLRALFPTRMVGPTGPQATGARLAGDLALWREARRRGLDQRAEVRAAERTQLALERRARLDDGVHPHELSAADVRAEYDRSRGDYVAPARVRVAELVSRDRRQAERWSARLRRAPLPFDELQRLLPESEDATARRTGGDLGWIDDRSVNYPEPLKRAALGLVRPGAIADVVALGGRFHVLVCREREAERVTPLAAVEDEIRARLSAARRGERARAKTTELRARLTMTIDWNVVRSLDTMGRLTCYEVGCVR